MLTRCGSRVDTSLIFELVQWPSQLVSGPTTAVIDSLHRNSRVDTRYMLLIFNKRMVRVLLEHYKNDFLRMHTLQLSMHPYFSPLIISHLLEKGIPLRFSHPGIIFIGWLK